jgi:hypothetical protein
MTILALLSLPLSSVPEKGLTVRRLAAGGEWIRTSSSGDAVSRSHPPRGSDVRDRVIRAPWIRVDIGRTRLKAAIVEHRRQT